MVPRALICQRSEYFDKLFRGEMIEARTGRATLKDVNPYVFRIFLGWLYSQTVYYDENRVEPAVLEANPEDRKARTTDDSQITEEGSERPSSAVPDDIEMQEDGDQAKVLGKPEEAAKMFSIVRANVKPPFAPSFKATITYETTIPSTSTKAPDENDPSDPVTWRYGELFQIYIFADEYESRGFLMAIFEVIQMKLLQKTPRAYLLPHRREVTFAVERLAYSAPLRRLLVDVYATELSIDCGPPDGQDQVKRFKDMPGDFMIECLVKAKRMHNAHRCKKCGTEGTGKPCDAKNHTSDDRFTAKDRYPCLYHDHDSDKEQALCSMRWGALASKLGF